MATDSGGKQSFPNLNEGAAAIKEKSTVALKQIEKQLETDSK